jgi:Pyridoxamine 5'-phosphate oxidase
MYAQERRLEMRASRYPAHEPQQLAEPMIPGAAPTRWDWVGEHLRQSTATYWLATVRHDGAPHVRPVLAVWVDGGLYVCMGPGTRKAGNLARDPRCVVTVEVEPLDLAVEGNAVMVRDEAVLARVAQAYDATYGWRVTVRNGAFDAAGGAPTAGPPPYHVYEVVPATAYGFGTDERLVPTRWRFPDRGDGARRDEL